MKNSKKDNYLHIFLVTDSEIFKKKISSIINKHFFIFKLHDFKMFKGLEEIEGEFNKIAFIIDAKISDFELFVENLSIKKLPFVLKVYKSKHAIVGFKNNACYCFEDDFSFESISVCLLKMQMKFINK